MPSLPELQRAFGAALSDAGQATAAASLFRGPGERTAARLAIYRGNIYGNCIKALESAYPIVRKIVGAEFFEAIAHAYVRAQPSESGDLNQYGAGLPEFLAGFPPVCDLAYLPDVARMEWLAHRAYFAADAAPFDAAALAGVPPERYALLRLRLAPGCALLESPWPVSRIWTIHQDHYEGAFEVDLDSGPDRVLIQRPRWRAEVVSLAPGDFAFLSAAARDETLGDALESGATHDNRFAPSTALARWIDAAVITRLV